MKKKKVDRVNLSAFLRYLFDRAQNWEYNERKKGAEIYGKETLRN